VILGLGLVAFGQTLSGSWTTLITIDPQSQTQTFKYFDSEIVVEYALSGWTFGSLTVLDLGGWVDQEFSFGGALGAFTLGGTIDFDPGTLADMFGYLLVDGGVSIAGVTFGFTWLLENQDVALELTGSGTAGLVTIDVTIAFGDMDVVPYEEYDFLYGYLDDNPTGTGYGADVCDLPWNSIDIGVTFPFCCADVTASVGFDCDGFSYACFQIDDIAFGNLPWLTLDAKVCFAREGDGPEYTYDKTFYLRPGFALGDIACFSVYSYWNWDGKNSATGWSTGDNIISIMDLDLTGVGVVCEIGGISFTGITYLKETGSKPGILYGTTWYEAYQVATTQDACCGPFDFDLTFYFGKTGLTLFELGEIIANISYDLGANFTFTTGLDVMMATGFSEWSIGFIVTW
jgi:hypothetical protein